MRILPFLALGLAVLAIPALASGDNVVMISVAHVGVPQKLPGLCQVDGAVRHVWQGRAFHDGQAVSLKVPCGTTRLIPLPPSMPTEGPRLTDPAVLRASTLGAAHIDDAGNLMWRPPNASRDVIWGYRVLQGVALRLGATA